MILEDLDDTPVYSEQDVAKLISIFAFTWNTEAMSLDSVEDAMEEIDFKDIDWNAVKN